MTGRLKPTEYYMTDEEKKANLRWYKDWDKQDPRARDYNRSGGVPLSPYEVKANIRKMLSIGEAPNQVAALFNLPLDEVNAEQGWRAQLVRKRQSGMHTLKGRHV
jgi:hypothetical protein